MAVALGRLLHTWGAPGITSERGMQLLMAALLMLGGPAGRVTHSCVSEEVSADHCGSTVTLSSHTLRPTKAAQRATHLEPNSARQWSYVIADSATRGKERSCTEELLEAVTLQMDAMDQA
ncbi:hypothetical protein NDU88_001047 [Pleurodeles waltl]|uniref:Uncharacterized protein n=1 Tax=Pleurodeles waltl TaxID=8319 RepID=A0AAV7KPX7_PLEWA|nr:hypothetical protein NDU88_001047 [Pleurodeles waltl]